MTVTAELLARTAAATREALEPLTGADWSVPARDLGWSCRATGIHLADDYFSYAGQVIGQPREGYVPMEVVVSAEAPIGGVLTSITVCAEMLRSAAVNAHPDSRAWHPYGTSDPNGFIAMGVVEGLVHTFDIAAGLGSDWRPPAELCVPVLERLFPNAPGGDPSAVLLWCAGRTALGDQPRLTQWRWHSAPPG